MYTVFLFAQKYAISCTCDSSMIKSGMLEGNSSVINYVDNRRHFCGLQL